jgi:hypothetical protein
MTKFDKQIRERLRLHSIRVNVLMANGMDREVASKQAMGEICYGEHYDEQGVLVSKDPPKKSKKPLDIG